MNIPGSERQLDLTRKLQDENAKTHFMRSLKPTDFCLHSVAKQEVVLGQSDGWDSIEGYLCMRTS